jgi:hypothetical protein
MGAWFRICDSTCCAPGSRPARANARSSTALLGTLLAVPFVADERGHPGIAAAIVCFATAVLMVPGAKLEHVAMLKGPALRVNGAKWMGARALALLTFVGDRSYSLYLVHWPIFAFANHVFITPVPGLVNLALLGVCATWTELQYRMVEEHFRKFAISPITVVILLLIPVNLIVLSVVWSRATITRDTLAREANPGFSRECDFKADFVAKPICQSKPEPRILVWGDSFAMHLVEGVVVSSPGGVMQATRTVCGPFLGIAPMNGSLYSRTWAESCIRFNTSVVKYLADHPEIEIIILSSALAQYVPGAEDHGWRYLIQAGEGYYHAGQNTETLAASLTRTIAALHTMGKSVVLFAPPPSLGFNIARCHDRISAGLPTISPYPGCTFTRAEYQAHHSAILHFCRGGGAPDRACVDAGRISVRKRNLPNAGGTGRCSIATRITLANPDRGF